MFTLDDVDWNQIPPDNNTGVQFPVQLRVASALGISNTYVTQDDAPDMTSAALTVHADVTNNTPGWQTGTVTAVISAPGGGSAIRVSQRVTLAGGASQTVILSPAGFRQLTISHPPAVVAVPDGRPAALPAAGSVSAGGETSGPSLSR